VTVPVLGLGGDGWNVGSGAAGGGAGVGVGGGAAEAGAVGRSTRSLASSPGTRPGARARVLSHTHADDLP
jgi:hypothetical protein